MKTIEQRTHRERKIAMMMLVILVGLASAALARADDAESGRQSAIETDCLLMVLDRIDLAARRDGVLTSVRVRMGDDIGRDELAFELGDEESRARFAVAEAQFDQAAIRANNQWSIRSAEAELRKSTKEAELLHEVGRTPFLERFRAKNTKEKDAAELESAKATHEENGYARDVAAAEVLVAQIDLQDRKTRSPLSGTVVQQYRHEGEWCKQGDPVLKILRMDRLMLQGIVNLNDIAPHRVVGLTATATFRIGDEAPVVMKDLTITRCSPEVDLDGNYLVWTTIENQQTIEGDSLQWRLRPGISGSLTINK